MAGEVGLPPDGNLTSCPPFLWTPDQTAYICATSPGISTSN